jgi:hypothetical protein
MPEDSILHRLELGRPGPSPVPLEAHYPATWRSGYAAACKAVYTGSIPVVAFSPIWRVSATPRTFVRVP